MNVTPIYNGTIQEIIKYNPVNQTSLITPACVDWCQNGSVQFAVNQLIPFPLLAIIMILACYYSLGLEFSWKGRTLKILLAASILFLLGFFLQIILLVRVN